MLKDIAGNLQLPLASRILLGISAFVQWIGWWLIPLVLIATPIALVRFYKTKGGKAIMDRIAMRLPILGKLCRMLDITRFARTLSVLLDAGVDVGNSIDLTADVMVMTPMRQAVRSARPQIIAGRELSEILRSYTTVHPRRHRRDQLRRRNRQASGEPGPSGRRL